MVAGGQGFDPDKATELGRFTFRVVTGALGAGIAILSVVLLVVGLMGDAGKLAFSVVSLLVLAASVWYWRRMDSQMTRAIEARRSERRADSGGRDGGRSEAPAHNQSPGSTTGHLE